MPLSFQKPSDLYTSDSLTQMKSHAAHRIPHPILSKLVRNSYICSQRVLQIQVSEPIE